MRTCLIIAAATVFTTAAVAEDGCDIKWPLKVCSRVCSGFENAPDNDHIRAIGSYYSCKYNCKLQNQQIQARNITVDYCKKAAAKERYEQTMRELEREKENRAARNSIMRSQ